MAPIFSRSKVNSPAAAAGATPPPASSEPDEATALRPRSNRRRRSRAPRSAGVEAIEAAQPAPPAPPPAPVSRGESGGARPRGGRGQGKSAAPAPIPEPTPADLPTLIARQTALIERQTQLIETLLNPADHAVQDDGASGNLMVEMRPRLGIFVDVPNILYAAERSGVTLDWGKVAAFLSRGRTLVRAVAYAPISDDPAARLENERFVIPFVDHGYRIVTKPLRRFTGGGVKANFDVELAIDILTMADRMDVIVLVSGDGDFRRLVEIVGSRGVRVEVLAFGQSTATDLRAVADRYIDIAAYVPELSAG